MAALTSRPVAQLPEGNVVLRALVGALSKDDVIEDLDFEQLADADEIARDSDIGVGRGGIAAGMVMGDNHGGRVGENRRSKNLARVDEQGVESALGHGFHSEQSTSGVEQDRLKGFDGVALVFLSQQIGHSVGSVEQGGFGSDLRSNPSRERERGLESHRFVEADAADLLEFVERGSGEFRQGREAAEKIIRDLNCGGALESGPEQDSDQFGRAE